jgi:hypothetical protein
LFYHAIDYLLVVLDRFKKEFLTQDRIYFNPFSEDISNLVKDKKSFALQKVSSKDWSFSSQEKYIISLERIKDLAILKF